MAFAVAALVVLVGALTVARMYQAHRARQLLFSYIRAPKVPLESLSASGISGKSAQYLEVDLNEAACGAQPAVTFRYDPAVPASDFTRTVTIDRPARQAGLTRVFLAVFDHFKGLEVSDTRPGCVVAAYRMTDLGSFPILLGATLPPEWESLPLYQRLAAWEGDAAYD